MAKKIKIICTGSKSLPVDAFRDFQGDLKAISKVEIEKLKQLIIKYGFAAPIFVWKTWILDGHQRLKALKELILDGWEIDDLPLVEIQAKTRKQAAELLLSINSHFAKFTDGGLLSFLQEHEIEVDFLQEIELPGISVKSDAGQDHEDEIPEMFQVLVDCESEPEQVDLLNMLQEKGYSCRALVS